MKTFLAQNGVRGAALYLLEQKLGVRLPLSAGTRWKASTQTEVSFWDGFLESRGAGWGNEFKQRLNPDTQVSPDVAELLVGRDTLKVLDVGAGPLTILGKYCGTRKLELQAVDPLARQYDELLAEHDVEPVVRTEELAAEDLTDCFAENSFDLVFAQNCIDHSVDPVKSIVQMIAVAKPGCYVYLKHSQNEAVKENWYGLHQWNLAEEDGDFIVSSRTDRVNFTKSYAHLGETRCEVDQATDLVMTRIRKRLPA